MEVLIKIGSYVIAFVCIAAMWYELLCFPLTMSLVVLVRKISKWLGVPVMLLLDAAKMTAAVFLSVWLITKLNGAPSWLMFIIPGVLVYQSDMWRLRRAQRGTSNVRKMLEGAGEPESYDQRHDIWMERAHFGGDMLGWIIGAGLCLRSASFF